MKTSTRTTQKWGALAFFLVAMAFIVAPLIYLFGNLRDAMWPFAYDLADFLYGPVWAASLVTAIFVLREHIREHAPRRMDLALLAAALAAVARESCSGKPNHQKHRSSYGSTMPALYPLRGNIANCQLHP